PGVAVALIVDGKTAWIAGYGHANVERQQPVTADTAFNIGSISKTVAAWGVMKLVEDGRIDLDAPVESYLTRWHLPDSSFDQGGVTMRRLLSHTAGLSLHGYPGFQPTDQLPTVEASLSGATNGPGAVFLIMEPGTQWKYSGGGYTLAQLIVEEVTGQRFHDYMEKAVLEPLGMTNSAYEWPDRVTKIAATPYDGLRQPIPGPRFTAVAAAGLQTTARDLSRFVEASLTPKVLDAETVRLMQQPANGASPQYGLGYGVSQVTENITRVGHGGSNQGWVANIAMLLESGDGLVVLTNASYGSGVIRQVRCAWSEWLSGLERTCSSEIGPLMISTTLRDGVDAAVKRYREILETSADDYIMDENQLNSAGYALLQAGRTDDALALFELNVEMFPTSWNPHDSLGEAYMNRGEIELAIKSYERSLELNPGNTGGAAMLERLREKQRPSDPD
ncbi:MAG: serine hydrolase, partial [Planctomycetota bacterium]